jgi:hypothetical protein
MLEKRFNVEKNQVILHSTGAICTTAGELVQSDVFERIVGRFCDVLREQDAPAIQPFLPGCRTTRSWDGPVFLLRLLVEHTLGEVAAMHPDQQAFLQPENRLLLHEFVEKLYDFWRGFDRFMVLRSEPGKSRFEKRPYRSFNTTIEALAHTVRATYRDICENITGDHPRIYRQAHAGCDVGLIAVPRPATMPDAYASRLKDIPFIRQVWIAPPLIINPPTNTRTGQFLRIEKNPLLSMDIDPENWLCYPAQVGPLVIFVYFREFFMDLGCSLANLFEIATDEQIAKGPDGVYLYGAPPEQMAAFGSLPTVFYDDEENGLLTGAIPAEDRFGYFGYLKKMTLTLHNIAMIKKGRMPYHGAMFRIAMKDGRTANIAILGDTATGKSESIEAFRVLARTQLRQLKVIADDMGSFEVKPDGTLLGYGTETGAFIRLDDLQQGYAFEQIDRAIIMSPQKVNARVVLPVTTLHEVLHGYPIDFLLYANNYEQVDSSHPVLERFDTPEHALGVFREGAAMAKGTTTSTGLVHSYFANIFGPPQYRQAYDDLAGKVFAAAFARGVFVGQLRTRLGISGFESEGPKHAARALLTAIAGTPFPAD